MLYLNPLGGKSRENFPRKAIKISHFRTNITMLRLWSCEQWYETQLQHLQALTATVIVITRIKFKNYQLISPDYKMKRKKIEEKGDYKYDPGLAITADVIMLLLPLPQITITITAVIKMIKRYT